MTWTPLVSYPLTFNLITFKVALMAVNVLGEEVEDASKSTAATKAEVFFSPYDDLAFVMYVDNEIADLVRNLDRKKKAAVAGK